MTPEWAAAVFRELLQTPPQELTHFARRNGLEGQPTMQDLAQAREILQVLGLALQSDPGPNWERVHTAWNAMRARHGELRLDEGQRPAWIRDLPAKPGLGDPAPGTATPPPERSEGHYGAYASSPPAAASSSQGYASHPGPSHPPSAPHPHGSAAAPPPPAPHPHGSAAPPAPAGYPAGYAQPGPAAYQREAQPGHPSAQPAYGEAQPAYGEAQPAYGEAQPAYAPAQPASPPARPNIPAAAQGYPPASNAGYAPAPSPGYAPASNPGHAPAPSPSPSHAAAPNPGYATAQPSIHDDVATYAAFCAACAAAPERIHATMIQHGITSDHMRASVDDRWQDRFDDDPALCQRWEELVRYYRAQLAR